PTVTVYNGATLLLEGIDLRGNTNNAVAVQAAGLVALDRVEITSNNGGGINATGTAELLVRNSIIAGNGDDLDAIALGQAKLELIYSSVAGKASLGSASAISCSPGHQASVRNSILF